MEPKSKLQNYYTYVTWKDQVSKIAPSAWTLSEVLTAHHVHLLLQRRGRRALNVQGDGVEHTATPRHQGRRALNVDGTVEFQWPTGLNRAKETVGNGVLLS